MFDMFGDLFDFDGDGLDIAERAAELGFIDEIIDDEDDDEDQSGEGEYKW